MTLCLYDASTAGIVMQDLKVEEDAHIFFFIPWEIKHQITNDSPLLPLITTAGSFDRERAEIIVELNGQDPLTGNCMKKRFSYVASEIFRDYKFVNVMKTDKHAKDTCEYVVDLTHFHDLEPITRTSHDILSSPASSQVYGACGQTEAP